MIYWLFGLSGAGKSTIANELVEQLMLRNFVPDHRMNVPPRILDGDEMRNGLCSGLGLSEKDREENIRRIAHVTKIVSEYTDVIVACMTPTKRTRNIAKEILCGECDFKMIHVWCPEDTLIERDPKGLYRCLGTDAMFSCWEKPAILDITCMVNTERLSIAECAVSILDHEQSLNPR